MLLVIAAVLPDVTSDDDVQATVFPIENVSAKLRLP